MNKIYPRTICNGPEDEIVISGISGRYPNALDLHELEHNLYNKVDMIDDDERRWRHDNPSIPKFSGKIHNIEKFDGKFFGIDFEQANTMDPQIRILLEKAYEAILDAGINPKSIRGTRTGVYIGSCTSDSDKKIIFNQIPSNSFGITGLTHSMLSSWISYSLGLNGPSFVIDTACSSSIYALNAAFTAMRNGDCDAALVGASNITLDSFMTLQFGLLGMLSLIGKNRSFDADASGYVRSEAVTILLLQKSSDAKRIYSTVLYSKTNCDGYKEEGITYPSQHTQAKLLHEFYKEINIKPETIDYIEAHSTGTVVGDPQECQALDKVFCKNRKKAMPIGSVKSNLGHSEPAAGMCSISKCILALENQLIPPNINFSKNRPDIKSLEENRLQVVHNTQKLDGPLIAINSFGFGGANAHCLLRANPKDKINKGIPIDSISRLVNWSGRTADACNTIHKALASQPLDAEFIALLHNTQIKSVPGNNFKSYGLYRHVEGQNAQCVMKEIQNFSGIKRPIVYVFSGMESQWSGMGAGLLELPRFRQTIQKCHDLLSTKGLDLLNIITSSAKTMFDNLLHSFVGIAAIQAALLDCLTILNIQPDYIIGHSIGELVCAYADDCLTLEQMILCAYSLGKILLEAKTIKGSMAAIGLSSNNIKNLVQPTIDVACHNSSDSCIISGPQNEIEKVVTKLVAEGIFARKIPCSNIAYHSRYITDMGPNIMECLLPIIPLPKHRSARWLSTSVPKSKWNLPQSRYCSAQYYTNNLLSSVLFDETASLLPDNAIVIEIAPHSFSPTILCKSLTKAVYIPLTQRGSKHNLNFFLTALGKVYLNGIDIAIENLYPKVEFPVSRGTPKISHLIKWDHAEDLYVEKYTVNKIASNEARILISLKNANDQYILGHTIDGRCLFPATGYLMLVWETFAKMSEQTFSKVNVQFNDVKYLRATTITAETNVEFCIMIQFGTGHFEISEGNVTVVTGYIKYLPSDTKQTNMPPLRKNDYPYLPTKDFYKELRLRGYQYSGLFRNVIEARSDGLHGKVRWLSNWVSFLDCILQISILDKDTRGLLVPTGIEKLTIDVIQHQYFLNKFDPENPETHFVEVFMNKNMDICQAGGIEMKGLNANPIGRRKLLSLPVLESYKFIPYMPTPKMTKINSARICLQHALENHPTLKVKCVEILNKNVDPFITKLKEAIEDLPLTTGDLLILSSEKKEHENINVEDGTLSSQSNCLFVITSNSLTNLKFLELSKASLIDHGYIISREAVNLEPKDVIMPEGFNLITVIPLDDETLVLLQKKTRKMPKAPIQLKISLEDKQFKWLEQLQTSFKDAAFLLYSQNESLSGIIGLVNCIRKEPGGHSVRCVFIDDPRAPPFDITHPFYKEQLELNFAINVYRNGQWGTYRHLSFDILKQKGPTDIHAYANLTQRGDLSSLRWLNGSFSKRFAGNQTKIHFAALNFRDIMLATGKLAVEVFGENRLDQECVLGFEYSGIDRNGNKIMGMGISGAIGTHIIPDPGLTWKCPENWSLEQAATVPVVYGTVYAALFLHANIKKGKSILIHAGTGGVGLAAIRVALVNGLIVFTTVSTKEKREFLLKTFSELKESHIGNSRDLSFETMIQIQTNGAGVDYVLNSLAEEKLHASLRCLGKGGKFLEIGKFDMANDTKISLHTFLKEISFHAVLVDNMFKASLEEKLALNMMIQKDIDAGIIKPLPATVYPASEVEAAFRFLASAKHMGKVLLKIRENPNNNVTLPITIYPRVNCDANASYVIVGGLGGFGLELVDWLIIRGARKMVISSSRGISKPYQAYRIKMWETYGATVKVNISNVGTLDGCETLLKDAIQLGPVAGIFNLAVILQDSILENQTVEKFQKCFIPKVNATIYLDQLSRKLCPTLLQFVVFSSVSCGRGNAGQSNYGMANSIMERVIEQRHEHKLPAKAIQWGAVGEVGLVADMQEDKYGKMEIGGTLLQKISSCLEELDNLLLGDCPVIASMVVAEKLRSKGNDIISSIMNIMTIRDIKSIAMDATLPELGMDSLMAVEIKQSLERDYDLILTPQDLRNLTFAKLHELNEQSKQSNADKIKLTNKSIDVVGLQMLFQGLGKETSYDKSVIRLPGRNSSTTFKTALILVPGIEGTIPTQFKNIASSIDIPTFCVQLTNITNAKTFSEIVEAIITDIQEDITKYIDTFYIVGYSFGSIIALHLANLMEKSGIKGKVVILDGSLPLFKKVVLAKFPDISDKAIEVAIFSLLIQQIFPEEKLEDIEAKFKLFSTWNERINKLLQLIEFHNIYSQEYAKNMAEGFCNRLKMVIHSKNSDMPKIKSSITLIRPTEVMTHDIDEDYELGMYTEDKVNLKYVEGNHLTIFNNPKLIVLLNELQPKVE